MEILVQQFFFTSFGPEAEFFGILPNFRLFLDGTEIKKRYNLRNEFILLPFFERTANVKQKDGYKTP